VGIARTVAQVTFVARGALQADNAPTVAKGASADLSASVPNVPWDVRATGALPTVLERNAQMVARAWNAIWVQTSDF